MKNALITGATSGIGAAFARKLGKEGYNLYITGRREEIIEKLAQEIREKHNVAVEVIIADFTIPSEVDFLLEKIVSVDIEFLVNNVGFGHEKRFLDDTYENQRKMIEAHIESFSKITHLVARKMKNMKKGQIINVSSLAAFTPASFNHLYSSTKSFVITFSEALYIELLPLGINIQALCPGFTKSDFHRSLDIKEKTFKNRGLVRWMSSEEVVRLSLKAIGKTGGIYIPGLSNKILYTIIKLLPRKLYYIMARHMEM
ncbi:SDR family oxidoreductase [uncultured Ilyobacter sp.]|uniref:SDR family NAD(P)-dependent oxidoreductase n=1 Tax=uncultured Ilyobacter sp. TaxID=544433 RepID=UPI0029F57A7E|nr:SDR family oxidoreductase [uncultured Ilyobacter sp.]